MCRRVLMSPSVILLLSVLLGNVMFARENQFAPGSDEEPTASREARTPPPVIPAMQEPVKVPASPMLAEGTAIPLLLTHDVKVKKAKPGDTVDFVLAQDLWYRDTLLARRGSPVQVVVHTAEKSKWLSRGSKLGFEIKNLRLLNGGLVPLRGELHYSGGINSLSGAAFSAPGQGGDTGAMIGAGAMVVGVFGLIAPGHNQDAKAGAPANVWVAEEFKLDTNSFRPMQPKHSPLPTTGKVQIVRPIFERLKSRDLYCNGIPLAHLNASRQYTAELKPGWYRFSINPKKPPLQIFVVSGEVYTLIASTDSMISVDPGFSGAMTEKISFARTQPRTAQQMVNDAKLVDKVDLYGDASQCVPLPEEFVQAPQSSGSNPSESPAPAN